MAEKGEVVDTVSLPPTYAPSEAYSDSPPPAYRRGKSTTVQVARMVCLTLVGIAFLIGFFTLTSNYLSAKECDCPNSQQQNVLPQVEKLVGEENLNKVEEMNGNGLEGLEEPSLSKVLFQHELEDAMAIPDAQEELDDNIPEEEVEALVEEVAELEEAEREMEEEQLGLQDIMNQEMDEAKKNIKLPIDLILGNPALAGRDVNCEVERRQQPIGGGIVTQAIIVTCRDNDDDQEMVDGPGIVLSPPGPRRLGPPLSLLAPIMKMLSSRARVVKPIQLKSLNAPNPFQMPPGPQPCSINGPFPCFLNQAKSLGPFPVLMNGRMSGPINGPMSGPMNGPMSGPMNGPMPGPMNGPMSGPINGHISGPFIGPMSDSFNGPFHGPMNGPFSGRMNSPLSGRMNSPFSGPMDSPFSGRMNSPFSGPMDSPFSGPNDSPFSGPMDSPFSGPINSPFSGPINSPFSGPMPGPNPGHISRHIHIPMNGRKPNAVPSPFRGPESSPSNGPIPSGPKIFMQNPIVTERQQDNEPRNRMLPFALRPLARMSHRRPRILALTSNPNIQRLQTPISSLQRGANNGASREPRIISANFPSLPEAQGRALTSPVTLPGLRLLPASLFSGPNFLRATRRDDSQKPITHMEMRQPEPKVPDFEPRFPDFGPPRVHTVIGPNQPSFMRSILPNMPPKSEKPTLPQFISKSIEIINGRHIPMEIMSPPKPVAFIHKPQPIAGQQIPSFPPPPPPPPPSMKLPPPPPSSSLPPPPPPSPPSSFRYPPPPPPPHMDPEGRPGFITNINPDAEVIFHSGPPPSPQPPHIITQEAHERPQPEEDRKHHLLVVS